MGMNPEIHLKVINMNKEQNIVCMQEVSDLHKCRKPVQRKVLSVRTPIFLIIVGCICSMLLCLPVLAEESSYNSSSMYGNSHCMNQGNQSISAVCLGEGGISACSGQNGCGVSCQQASCSGNCQMGKMRGFHACEIGNNAAFQGIRNMIIGKFGGCSGQNFPGNSRDSGNMEEYYSNTSALPNNN